jgi:hypothetical protein
MVDQAGTTMQALQDLEDWIRSQGYFLHCVSAIPDASSHPENGAARIANE